MRNNLRGDMVKAKDYYTEAYLTLNLRRGHLSPRAQLRSSTEPLAIEVRIGNFEGGNLKLSWKSSARVFCVILMLLKMNFIFCFTPSFFVQWRERPFVSICSGQRTPPPNLFWLLERDRKQCCHITRQLSVIALLISNIPGTSVWKQLLEMRLCN